jgi:disulfide bond formation protein DsbB
MNGSRRHVLSAIALIGFGAVGAALVTQHAFDMQPCPWCILQRLVFVVIGLTALLGMAWESRYGRRVLPLLLLLLCSFGVAAALWQHFVAAVSSSCNLTLADRIVSATQLDEWLPAVFQPRASCADSAVDLLGVPYEFWSLGLFLLLEGAALWLLLHERRMPARTGAAALR